MTRSYQKRCKVFFIKSYNRYQEKFNFLAHYESDEDYVEENEEKESKKKSPRPKKAKKEKVG